MAKTKVLITVKTYPVASTTYDELVCTAGMREDGTWIRIYPVPFRKLDYEKQYEKYRWIEVDLVKNTSDFRPESYRPRDIDDENTIRSLEKLDTSNNWKKRKEIVLQHVYDDLTKLIAEAKDKNIRTSLAVFKPTEIIDFVWEEVDRDWKPKQKAALKQGNLFLDKSKDDFRVVNKLPYKFSFIFKDVNGKKSKLMIEDWEVGALYWNSLRRKNYNEAEACKDVWKKYFENFAKTKDLYFFLGTTKVHHARNAPNPFVIIGAFYPKKEVPKKQLSLF